MMKSNDFRGKANDLNSDIELSIAKYLMKNKDIKYIENEPIEIGTDTNNVRCVLLNNVPIRTYNIDFNIHLLEEIENIVEKY